MGNKDRGSTTHGHGSSKKNRGAGNRGGRGNTGLGKKSKHKKFTAMRGEEHLGEKGFSRPAHLTEEDDTINVMKVDQYIDRFVEDGVAEETDDGYVFDAEAAGFDKVLGKGRLTQDIDIKAPAFSDSARRKIEENGNEAIELEE